VIGVRDGRHDCVEVSDELRVIARDLLFPDPRQQNDLAAVEVSDDRPVSRRRRPSS
jgi:hypothetical protein